MDEQCRQHGSRVVVATFAYALVVADVVAATTSLVAGDPWDWGRFLWFFLLVLLSAVASSATQAVVRASVSKRSASPPKTRRPLKSCA